jgi:transposase-like protein
MTIGEWERAFPHEDACRAYLVKYRWPLGVRCPRCGNPGVYELPSRKWHWQCEKCAPDGYRFSHITGTIFENTNKPLRDWFRVIHMMLTSKKGVSALEIKRVMGFGSYKTAWYMCHRVRAGLANEEFRKLMGIVEVDETFIGGKAINKHGRRDGSGGGSGRKTPIVGAVQRKGKVVARVLERVTKEALQTFVREVVSNKVSLIATDEHKGYVGLSPDFNHGRCTHAVGKYVIGAIHTNTIEGFWSIFKRGIVGSFHKVSRKYMPLYIAEFQFRYNNRENPDIFAEAIKGC